MLGSSASFGIQRFVATQQDWIYLPRYMGTNRRAVILLHGQLQTGQEWKAIATPGQSRITKALNRFPMISLYTSGASWGNDTSLANIETARALLGNIGCEVDKIVIVGASMGALVGLNYARANPTRIAALIGIMPACDLDDCRDNNRGGTAQANINTAWGMPVGSDSGSDPLPERANPNSQVNADLISSAQAPIRLYYSTADTIVIPSTVESLASKLNGYAKTKIVSTSVDHTDALFDAVNMDEAVDLIEGVV